jgi:hypothetical protein
MIYFCLGKDKGKEGRGRERRKRKEKGGERGLYP